ncbi:MAG: HAD-IIIC family phosphatase [Candidatus Sericytochromatia bacterium]|nr:HAD-IIIC family phosphatase [Candidatus Sericytochromatia bacterium]
MTTSRPHQQILLDEHATMAELLQVAAHVEADPQTGMQALRLVTRRSTDYTVLTRAARIAAKLILRAPPPWRQHVRIALLGTYTTAQMPALLRLYLAVAGINAECYEASFGQMAQELLVPSADLLAFRPDIVLLIPSYRETQVWQSDRPGPADVAADLQLFRQLWAQARTLGMTPIQLNIDLPADTPMGNLCGVSPLGVTRWLRELNLHLGDAAQGTVTVIDVDRLAARIGTSAWSDARFWYSAKQAVALPVLPQLCSLQAAIIRSLLGLTAKVLVLDLDNTLWGGVVGEDGVANLELNGSARGEAFVAFQTFCRKLKDRGVLLAVVSKNNPADALQPFQDHPEMVLRRDDFAAFQANWLPKSDNIRAIARDLDLGYDSFVFFDDNPAERAEVRAHLPDVHVIDVPEGPADYIAALARSGAFETAQVTAEDLRRAADYQARQQAVELQAASGSQADFLSALAMTASWGPCRDVDLPRISQLVQKTNQFNLTTQRHSEGELRAFMTSPSHDTLTVRLADRFADRGLIALLIAAYQDQALIIETWLMSCRVLGRTVEAAMFHHVVAWAQARGAAVIVGTYRPTPKNALVAELYAQFGFQRQASLPDGTTVWHLPVTDGMALPATYLDTAKEQG